METTKQILEKALKLKPHDRSLLVEGILRSLDEPDRSIDEIWATEAEERLAAHRAGKTSGIPVEQVFGEEIE